MRKYYRAILKAVMSYKGVRKINKRFKGYWLAYLGRTPNSQHMLTRKYNKAPISDILVKPKAPKGKVRRFLKWILNKLFRRKY